MYCYLLMLLVDVIIIDLTFFFRFFKTMPIELRKTNFKELKVYGVFHK